MTELILGVLLIGFVWCVGGILVNTLIAFFNALGGK